MDKKEEGRQKFEARPKRERRSIGLLTWAIVPTFLGLMALTNGSIGWAVGLFALAAVLAVPGLVGFVLSGD